MNPDRRRMLGLCLAMGVLGALASAVWTAFRFELGLDWLFRLRGPIEAPDDVVVVSIDAESADGLGLPPDPDRWPRSLHAELVRRLSAAGAAIIVFDISFDMPRNEDDDSDFAAAVQEAGNVILLEQLDLETVATHPTGPTLEVERRRPPILPLDRAALSTAPFPLPKDPSKVSQFWVFGPSNPNVLTLPSVALLAYSHAAQDVLIALITEIRPEAAAALEHRGNVPGAGSLAATGSRIRRLLRSDPDLGKELLERVGNSENAPAGFDSNRAGRGQLFALARLYTGTDSRYLNFYGPMRSIRTIPYHAIVSNDWDPATARLGGAAVFVGFSAQLPIDQQDFFETVFTRRGASLSGVEIGATAFANFRAGNGVVPLPMPAHYLLVLLWGIATTGLLMALSTRGSFAAAIIAGTAYLSIASALFRSTAIWLPVVVPVFGQIPAALLIVFVWKYSRAQAQSDRATETLGFYLPAQVVDQLSRETSSSRPSTQLLHGTCLVTDAEQYTALSERLGPQELHNLLNEYYGALFSEVERYGGFVSDVVGDSMVAMWTSREPDPAARTRACRAALAIITAVETFNAERSVHRLPTRIGVHSGQVLLGDIGAESHFEYRAVGDIVSTATRIQGLNKHLRTNLLVSNEALEGADVVFSRSLGGFVLAGKSMPLQLNDMLGFDESVPASHREIAARFATALACFHNRQWDDAARRFSGLLTEFPGDGPCAFYLKLCRQYMESDPGPSWAGHVIVSEK